MMIPDTTLNTLKKFRFNTILREKAIVHASNYAYHTM